jgi:hypothetical protein
LLHQAYPAGDCLAAYFEYIDSNRSW